MNNLDAYSKEDLVRIIAALYLGQYKSDWDIETEMREIALGVLSEAGWLTKKLQIQEKYKQELIIVKKIQQE